MENTIDPDLVKLFGYTRYYRKRLVCFCCKYPYIGTLFNHSPSCSYMWDIYNIVKYAYSHAVDVPPRMS